MLRSAHSSAAAAVRVERLSRSKRAALAALACLALAWLAYTRLYFVLHPMGLTFDPSVFMWNRQAGPVLRPYPDFRLDLAR